MTRATLAQAAGHRRWPIRPILGFWESKVPQNM